MATKRSAAPPLFNFLKEGALLPGRNRSLFAAVFALALASTSLLLMGGDLAVQPLVDQVRLDGEALNSTASRAGTSPEEYARLSRLLQEIRHDVRALLLAVAAYLLFAIVLGSAVRIVVLSAAVATYSGEPHTFGSLLGKVMARLKGPALTLAFVYAVQIAYIALLSSMTLLLVFLMMHRYNKLLLAESLVLLAGYVFLVYLCILCAVSVVVAVAEPGCHGSGAVARAWRLVRDRKRRAVLLVAATGALAAACYPVHALAQRCALRSVPSAVLLEVVYAVLTAAVSVFDACAMTAFYYECKESTEAAAEYTKLSTQEQMNA